MSEIPSYPKVHTLGHPAIADLLDGRIVIQEKYDGSQLSWTWDTDGHLHVRSKGSIQYGGPDNRTEPDSLFAAAVDYLLTLTPPTSRASEWVFRGEWLSKPKHNTLAYDRTPPNGLILYDIELQPNVFVNPNGVQLWAEAYDIGSARCFHHGPAAAITLEWLTALLDEDSTLGDVKVEGVVIKNYDRFGRDGKILAGKLVSEAFKERHKREWKGANPSAGDIIDQLITSLNTEARWRKAIQHLRDDGRLEGSPRDIGPLMAEIKRDTVEEEREWIAGKLLEWALPKVSRAVGRGLPEFYKAELATQQFDDEVTR